MPGWIDISLPVRTGMVRWPGDPVIEVNRIATIGLDDSVCNVTAISMCAHTGTHMDAPLHFIAGAASMESLPLDAVMGPARVIEIHHPSKITREELLTHDLQRGERILFKTANSARLWKTDQFLDDFIYITPDAADYLAESCIQTVGIDAYSVGGYHDRMQETHVSLLSAGIWIIEGLALEHVAAGTYELVH